MSEIWYLFTESLAFFLSKKGEIYEEVGNSWKWNECNEGGG